MNENILVRGRWIVVDADSAVHSDAALLVRDGQVAEVGDWSRLRRDHPELRVIGDERCAVIPGLVNAHHHSHAVSAVLQGVSDDLLEPWILAWHGMRDVDPGLNTLVSCGIQLGAGVTSVVDMCSAGGSAQQFADDVTAALQAHQTAGLRVAFAPGVASRSFLVAGVGEDERFIASLPRALRDQARLLLPAPGRISEADYFAVMAELQQNWAQHPRVDLWYGPPGPQWVSDECLQRCAEEAARWDCGIQTHVNESFYEKLHGGRAYGKPTMLHLRDLGILSPRLTIAHGTWLDRAEIEAMAQSGAALSHNPSSNLRLRAGIAPFLPCLRARLCVGIGMDATTLNENEDMFAEMRLALRLACDPRIEREVPGVGDVFAAATRGGARLMGKAEQIGCLRPGYAADLVLLNTDRMLWPWASPEIDPLELIALRAARSDIEQVLIGGELVWDAGAPTRFDLQAAARELAARLQSTGFPHERQRAVQAVNPHLRAWYAAWESPQLEPWTVYGSGS